MIVILMGSPPELMAGFGSELFLSMLLCIGFGYCGIFFFFFFLHYICSMRSITILYTTP